MSLPKISVITPSFNQAEFLEETILSVIGQQYPNLEFIIIDGGSTDASVEVIKKYERQVSYWFSEPDGGQSEALAKGFARATGDILCWLCSDDLFKPGTLHVVGGVFAGHPDLDLLYGDTEYLYPDGTTRHKPRIFYNYDAMLFAFNIISQPSSFFSRRIYQSVGGLDTELNFAMDYDLFIRFGRNMHWIFVPTVLSSYRLHAGSKTVAHRPRFLNEWNRVREKALGRPLTFLDRAKWYAYTVVVVWKFIVERKIWKLKYDNTKYKI